MHKSLWQKLFSWYRTRRPARAAETGKRRQFRPAVEGLEERAVPTASISGHVWLDQTGNGASASSPAMKGVAVRVYADTNHDGTLDSGDRLVAGTVTGADGSYAFTHLKPGHYFVTERAPHGYVRTVPTTADSFYSVTLANGQSVTGQDFANFHKPHTHSVRHISFTITSPDGTQTTVTNLRGHTQQGDTVTVNFTVARGAGPTTVTLVSYNAPGASFDANTASQQTIDVVASGTFGPGHHSLTVPLPDNFYQVDFVLGDAITQFGPAGSNVFYSAQGRLLSADNGGTNAAFTPSTLSGNVFQDNTGTGTPGNGNPGLSGVTVLLSGFDSSGHAVNATATTDSNGNYTFTGLMPGTYTLTVSAIPNFSVEGTGVISNITVASGTTGTGYNFGEIPSGGS
jgi:protocatechuate 3,4-dioxygenase beta subunit